MEVFDVHSKNLFLSFVWNLVHPEVTWKMLYFLSYRKRLGSLFGLGFLSYSIIGSCKSSQRFPGLSAKKTLQSLAEIMMVQKETRAYCHTDIWKLKVINMRGANVCR